MKLKGSILPLLLMIVALSLGSCDKDDDIYPGANSELVKELNKLYPDARNVEWERKSSYSVADCYWKGAELNVWFGASNNWVQTEEALIYNALPAAVTDAFTQSKYGSWAIDEVTKLSFPENPTLFVVEVEQGKQEIALFYSELGKELLERNVAGDDTLWPDLVIK